MTETKGLPVAGYKPTQPAEAIEAVNVNKHIEEMILRDMDRLKEGGEGMPSVDQRWLAIARTKIEEAFMAYNRAIFQPGRIGGELRAFTVPQSVPRDPTV